MNNIETPDIEGQLFHLSFKDGWMTKLEPNPIKFLKWYYRYLGLYLKYDCEILKPPILEDDCWSYPIGLKTKMLYWLGIKLKTWKI